MSEQSVIYAIEIGGTHTRCGVFVDGHIDPVAVVRTPHNSKTPDDNPAALLSLMQRLIEQASAGHRPMEALAVSVTGMLRIVPKPGARDYGPLRDSELVLASPNIDGLKNVPFMAWLESGGWNVPIHVENDANAALRSAVDHPTALSVNMGTGVAAALKRDNRIVHVGETWSCYEMGHGFRWSIPEEVSRKCACGSVGCLEATIGARALSERYGVHPEDAGPDVYARMRADVVEYLGPAIADTAERFGMSIVLLSGGTAMGFSDDHDFVGDLQRSIASTRPDAPHLDIRLLGLSPDAGLLGVCLALLDHDIAGHDHRVN